MLHRSAKLHHRHLERPIPADRDHLPVWGCELGPNRRRKRITHRPHAARGQKTPAPRTIIPRRPKLVLPHIRNIDRIRLHLFRQGLYQTPRVSRARFFSVRARLLLPQFPQMGEPLLPYPGRLLLTKLLDDCTRIPHQRDGCTEVFADLGGVNVDMHHFGGLFECRRGVYRPVAYPRTDDHQQVALLDRAVGIPK